MSTLFVLILMFATKPSKQDFVDYTNMEMPIESDEYGIPDNRKYSKDSDFILFCVYKMDYMKKYGADGFGRDRKKFIAVAGNLFEI